jgi:hypothetical protein
MKPIRFVQGRWKAWQMNLARRRLARQVKSVAGDISRADWAESLRDPTGFYLRCFHYFHTHFPQEGRRHRGYFARRGRGFGEDTFHVMWYLLLSEFKPERCLEIGVYRGQVISLWALLARLGGWTCAVHGVSPFTSAGDSVSKYSGGLDYLSDTLANFQHFGLPAPTLLKAYSTDPPTIALMRSCAWSLIYIDGSHEYEIARQDWENATDVVRLGGILVLDDAALGTAYRPPIFATAGHPGPSRLAEEIDRSRFQEILQVGHNRAFQRIA